MCGTADCAKPKAAISQQAQAMIARDCEQRGMMTKLLRETDRARQNHRRRQTTAPTF
jgi:hypothetical protein